MKTALIRSIYFLLLTAYITPFKSEKIKIRIFSHIKISELIFTAEKGPFKIIADGKDTLLLYPENIVTILRINDSIELKYSGKNLGKFIGLKIISLNNENLFSVRSIVPERKKKFYEDNLIVGLDKLNNTLRLINWLETDKYIGGVVEAEAGRKSHPEFYKVQSILARTYAMSIAGRHITEGHDLCDQVHCQAFYGRTKDTSILNSVSATRELLVVDKDFNLIHAVFHSNSGGQTANAEDVWGKYTNYLRSVKDSFSLHMPNYQWTRKMASEDWLEYLRIKFKIQTEDSLTKLSVLNFRQQERKTFIDVNGKKIPLKNIRMDLNLKSTYFELKTENDTVVFTGRGYGHGIGMCQEGAMQMAKLGYKYDQIIKFYYREIKIINRNQLAFFREY